MIMKIGIAADHGGYELKQIIHPFLLSLNYEVTDFGAYEQNDLDDYPDYVIPLSKAVATKEVEKGIPTNLSKYRNVRKVGDKFVKAINGKDYIIIFQELNNDGSFTSISETSLDFIFCGKMYLKKFNCHRNDEWITKPKISSINISSYEGINPK